MKTTSLHFRHLLSLVIAPLFLTGCYTQLQTYERPVPVYDVRYPENTPAEYYSWDREESAQPVEQPLTPEDSAYEFGYVDGYHDATLDYRDLEAELLWTRFTRNAVIDPFFSPLYPPVYWRTPSPFWFAGFYDPFFYDPFICNPFFYDPFRWNFPRASFAFSPWFHGGPFFWNTGGGFWGGGHVAVVTTGTTGRRTGVRRSGINRSGDRSARNRSIRSRMGVTRSRGYTNSRTRRGSRSSIYRSRSTRSRAVGRSGSRGRTGRSIRSSGNRSRSRSIRSSGNRSRSRSVRSSRSSGSRNSSVRSSRSSRSRSGSSVRRSRSSSSKSSGSSRSRSRSSRSKRDS